MYVQWQAIPASGLVGDCTAGMGAVWVTKASTGIVVASAALPNPPSALTAAFSLPTPPPIVTGAIKFHPGHYIELDPGSGCGTVACYVSTMATLKGSSVVGVFLIQPWANLEFAEGVYTGGVGSGMGFDLVDQLLVAAKADGLQLMIGETAKAYGTWRANAGSYGVLPPYFTTTKDSTGVAPLYIDAQTGAVSGSLVVSAKLYDPVVTQRKIALAQAYGGRYDSNPNFEMWHDEDETANGLFTSSSQYDALNVQLIAWAKAARAAFPTSGLRATTNFEDTAAQFSTLFAGLAPSAVAVGGPDVWLNLPGTPPFAGTDAIVFNGYLGGKDWRGILARVAEVQWGDSQAKGLVTQAQVYAEEFTGTLISGGSVMPNYFIWGASQENPAWTLASTLAYIKSINGVVNTTRPSSYH